MRHTENKIEVWVVGYHDLSVQDWNWESDLKDEDGEKK